MPLYDLAQARTQTATLNARMATAKADGTFAAKEASFQQQFRDIFSNTSLGRVDGFDQDESGDESNNGPEVSFGLLAS